MTNEIKEVLAYFKKYIKITAMHDSEPMLNWKHLKIVLNYITSLQQENERLSRMAQIEDNKKIKEDKMKFECLMYGKMKYGKWARGIFSFGEFCNIKSIYEIKSEQDLVPKKIYNVKHIDIVQKRNGTLSLILEI